MTKAIENDNHKELFELLPLYVNNSLDAEKTLAVEKHLNDCIECQNELNFERSLQESISINEVDMTELSVRNLPKFNAQLDQLIAKKSQAAALDRIPKQSTHSTPLMQRIFDYGRALLTPGPALGGALVLGCCGLVVVGVLSRSGDSGQMQSPLRGCEHVVKQHKLRIVASNVDSVSDGTKYLLEEHFPGSDFTVETVGDNNVVVSLKGDTCMIPLLINDLEKMQSVSSVTVS